MMKFKRGDKVWWEIVPLFGVKGIVLRSRTFLWGLIKQYRVLYYDMGVHDHPEGVAWVNINEVSKRT